MSTYYKLNCPECGETGGFFSRQAWGWGNADILDTFKFLCEHAHCREGFRVLSEHDDDYYDDGAREKWMQKVADPDSTAHNAWPHTEEWALVSGGAGWAATWNKIVEKGDFHYPEAI